MKPLTTEQQQFAAAHHELVSRYLSHHQLSEEDYYDVVIFGFLRAVQNYLERPELKKYAFSAIACREMDIERRRYQQKQKGFSRMARVFSLESPISQRTPARESLMEGLQLQEMMATLSRTEQEILDLLLCYDDDVDAVAYCEKALELYNIYKDCYSTSHVDSVLQAMLEDMQATKLSIKGNLYFVPKVHLDKLEVFEEYVEALAQNNRGSDLILANSMYVVDDAKQRQKMADEFKVQYAKDIAFYKERIQHFLDGDNRSTALCERWVKKIDALKQKKETYESVLKKDLANLEQDFALLQLQARELQIRANKIVVTDPNQMGQSQILCKVHFGCE